MSRTFHHGKRRFVKYPSDHYPGGGEPAGPKWRRTKIEAHWMSTPSWWIREMMTRPQRAKTRAALHKAMKGVDADFPLPKKPHVYYW